MKRILAATAAFAISFSLVPTAAITQEYEFFYNRVEIRQGDVVQVSTRLPFKSKNGKATFRGTEYDGYITGGILNVLIGVDLDTEPVLRYS